MIPIALYSRVYKEEDHPYIRSFFQLIAQYPFKIFIYKSWLDQLPADIVPKDQFIPFEFEHEIRHQIEYFISLGGDGTLLDTITMVRDSGIPIVGINLGRLGFLANIGRDTIAAALLAIQKRAYVIDSRMLIHLDANKPVFDDTRFALNEFSIHKKDSSAMIIIHTYINGELLNSYWADGLIVATPTGSTGYSLSCGGPIIFPSSESFVITAVAPHNLNVRPIIVSSDSVISFEIEGRSESFLCTLDGRHQTVDTSFQLAVRKEDFYVKLIRIQEDHFLNTLRTKLLWGLDKRN